MAEEEVECSSEWYVGSVAVLTLLITSKCYLTMRNFLASNAVSFVVSVDVIDWLAKNDQTDLIPDDFVALIKKLQ